MTGTPSACAAPRAAPPSCTAPWRRPIARPPDPARPVAGPARVRDLRRLRAAARLGVHRHRPARARPSPSTPRARADQKRTGATYSQDPDIRRRHRRDGADLRRTAAAAVGAVPRCRRARRPRLPRWFSLLSGVKHRARRRQSDIDDRQCSPRRTDPHFSTSELSRLYRDVLAGAAPIPPIPESAHAARRHRVARAARRAESALYRDPPVRVASSPQRFPIRSQVRLGTTSMRTTSRFVRATRSAAPCWPRCSCPALHSRARPSRQRPLPPGRS